MSQSDENERKQRVSKWKEPDELRALALAKLDVQVIRLEDELAEWLKLLSFLRTSLTNEAMSGMGYKQMAVNKDTVNKMKELSSAFRTAGEIKLKLDAKAKERAEEMTPEDEKAAVQTYIKAMDARERGVFLNSLVAWHNEVKFNSSSQMRVRAQVPDEDPLPPR